jgi:hypothetical protein
MTAERRTLNANGRRRPLQEAASILLPWLLCTFVLAGCDRPEPLTPQKAQEIVSRWQFHKEPVYAEVPQRVWWNTANPKDNYDEKALRTLRNLERSGLVTVAFTRLADGGEEYQARVTQKGFPILGTAPSYRGPVYRGKICEKVYDGLRNFQRHPSEPTVGHGEIAWHYTNPTALYPLFETKINKPLDKTFATLVSFYFKNHEWKFDVTVKKTESAT